MRLKNLVLTIGALAAFALTGLPAQAAEEVAKTLAAKGGETVELMPVYGVRNCQSTLASTPEVEVLQGPPEVKLSVKEEMIQPKTCKNKIKGGILLASIAKIEKPVEGKLTFRVKYKAQDGQARQTAHVYNVTLFP
jgi:hypothetical protein